MFLLGGICLVFVFFFGQSLDTLATERSFAAIVDGETITEREFDSDTAEPIDAISSSTKSSILSKRSE